MPSSVGPETESAETDPGPTRKEPGRMGRRSIRVETAPVSIAGEPGRDEAGSRRAGGDPRPDKTILIQTKQDLFPSAPILTESAADRFETKESKGRTRHERSRIKPSKFPMKQSKEQPKEGDCRYALSAGSGR
jgi:hypothetical protein